ncbi:MAG: protein kinase, partial [Planctomycetes bacterium]|nr:protein kinase [Planctomycetota bacterium]
SLPMTPTQLRLLVLALAARRGLLPSSTVRAAFEEPSVPGGDLPPGADSLRHIRAADTVPIAEAPLLLQGPLLALSEDARAELESEAQQLAADPAAAERALSALELPRGMRERLWGTGPRLAETQPPGSRPVVDAFLHGRRYTVLKEHARGGAGRILIAIDHRLGREVAIKELLHEQPAPGGSEPLNPRSLDAVRERFLREARITGQLEHPNVVPVYEIGARDDGTLFYTMKLVRGRTLAEEIQRIQADTSIDAAEKLARRLKLLDAFTAACQAIAYAHARGVVNRDLKSQNVMLGDFGETVVLDWGLAHARGQEDPDRGKVARHKFRPPRPVSASTSDSALTMDGQVMGTPLYMSPEQAAGNVDEVDERSDVYSLGVILYEILTGGVPYDGADAQTVLTAVLKSDPVPVREREPRAPAELVAIVERAMKRDRSRRLDSAKRLAAEVTAYRDGRDVTVYEYTLGEQARRLLSRYRTVAIAVAGSFLILFAALAAALHEAREEAEDSVAARLALAAAEEAEADARAREGEKLAALEGARRALERAEGLRLAAVAGPLAADNPAGALLLALEAARRAPGAESNGALLAALLALRETRRLYGHESYVVDAAVSADGRRIATASLDHTVRVWDAATGRSVARLDSPRGAMTRCALSSDGGLALTLSEDGTARVWDVGAGTTAFSMKEAAEAVFAGDRAVLVRGRDGAIRFCALSGAAPVELRLPGEPASALAASADGAHVAALGAGGGGRLWDSRGSEVASLADPEGPLAAMAFSPDGASLAVITRAGRVRVLDAGDGAELARFAGAADFAPESLAWPAAGGRLLAAGHDGCLQVWDAASRAALAHIPATPAAGPAALSPDGRLVARADQADADLLDAATGARVARLRGHEYQIQAAAFTPDSRRLVTASRDHTAILWDVTPGGVLAAEAGDPGSELVALRPGAGRAVVRGAGSGARGLRFVDTLTGTTAASLNLPPFENAQARFDPSGVVLLVRPWGQNRLFLFDAADGRPRVELGGDGPDVVKTALSHDGAWAAALHADLTLRVWATRTGRLQATFKALDEKICTLAVSADGAWIATANGPSQDVTLYRTASGEPAARLHAHTGFTLGVEFSPDGRRLVTTAADASARVWSLPDARPLASFRWPRIEEIWPRISPDGRWFSLCGAGAARVCLLESATEHLAFDLGHPVAACEFAPDSSSVALAFADGRILHVPIDIAAAASAAVPRDLTPAEAARWRVGPPEEQKARAEALRAARPSASAFAQSARKALRAGNFEEAVADGKRAAELLPVFPDAWYWLAAAHAARGAAQPEGDARKAALSEALDALERLASLEPEWVAEFEKDELFAPLSGEDRFQKLLKVGGGGE